MRHVINEKKFLKNQVTRRPCSEAQTPSWVHKVTTTQWLPDHDSLKALTENFDKFFVNKIKAVRKELDCKNATLDTANQTQEIDVTPLIQFRLATKNEIDYMLSKSAPETYGLDQVPTSLARTSRRCAYTEKHYMSMHCGLFPPCLKNAHVTPRLKKPSLDHDALNNYRPVSNLSFLSKVIEKGSK